MKVKIIFITLILLLTLTTFTGCQLVPTNNDNSALLEPAELSIWGIFDSSDNYRELINAYTASHPKVKITYTKLRWEEYEKKLLEGWAEGTGPDIFMVHNTWIKKYQNRSLALPEKVKIPVIETSGVIKKKNQVVIKQLATLTPYQIKELFPDVVYKDVVLDNTIYALPFSVDTLALYYNRDHLNAAGITAPPKTWQELIDLTKKLTLQNENGEIIRSAVALGGADNINRSNDILSLLMLQNGTTMVNDRSSVEFHRSSTYNDEIYPGQQALDFYTNFALPSKETYTWNVGLPESIEMFSAGNLSLLFGFAFQANTLRAQAPRINLGIAPVPHINADGSDALGLPVNLASYWCFSVYKNTKQPDKAWDFLVFAASKQYRDEKGETKYYVESYLDSALKPPALKTLINKYKEKNPEQSVFVNQILTAQSWYHGRDPDNMNQIFKQMINSVIQGKSKVKDAVGSASRAVQQTY